MLEPDQRQLLLEALRPPAGFQLDCAIGTTYSLDLDALLIVPLAFALFDAGDEDVPDPVALLAAVREHAERITLFAQAGAINVPREFRRLAAYLEESVVPVSAPRPGHIFHPKTWLLRYVDQDGAGLLRALVATRNLTFSRSWDTIVVLESGEEGTPNGDGLARFVEALPSMAQRPLPDARQQSLSKLAGDARLATFAAPAPFTSVGFYPLGLPNASTAPSPLDGRADRWLVVSPFLTSDAIARFGNPRGDAVLVSRPESIAHLAPEALGGFGELFVLSDRAFADESNGESVAFTDEAAAERPEAPLMGLHGKLYIADAGWKARVISGSANATRPAWGGNVEVVVEMIGPKGQVGIDAFLACASKGSSAFRDLLEPFTPPADVEPLTPREELLRSLEIAQRDFASGGGTTTVAADGAAFDLLVEMRGPVPTTATPVVWPISLHRNRARPLAEGSADFKNLSFTAITAFVAVELTMEKAGLTESVRFVVPTQLRGAPDDRLERLLTEELKSAEDVLRYLLLLLAVDESTLGLEPRPTAPGNGSGTGWAIGEIALLEAMLRVITRDRGRLAAVDRLVLDLQRTSKGEAALPPHLLEIWHPIREALRDA